MIGCVGCVETGAGDGEVLRDYLAGDSAHDVDAEFEALGVDPIGEGLESRIVCGGGEAGGVGDEDSVFIPDIFASFECGAEGILHVPAFVDDGVLPAVLADGGEDLSVGSVVGFVDGEAVGVPAIPAHGRGGCGVLCGCGAKRAGNESETEKEDQAGS